MRALWVAVILLLDAGPVRAQQGDRWQLTLNDGTEDCPSYAAR